MIEAVLTQVLSSCFCLELGSVFPCVYMMVCELDDEFIQLNTCNEETTIPDQSSLDAKRRACSNLNIHMCIVQNLKA